ncbi:MULTISPECIES: hypothetical protein [Spirulina sp. CCY15215]|uniref:hypothetical protein n=1 Tax=Spirulina sp. CCY15215 TaxID=2767591 RepID=UPI00194F1C43|nr:hypothetical protein [Spirulina major]
MGCIWGIALGSQIILCWRSSRDSLGTDCGHTNIALFLRLVQGIVTELRENLSLGSEKFSRSLAGGTSNQSGIQVKL